jgi:hypothetical protein
MQYDSRFSPVPFALALVFAAGTFSTPLQAQEKVQPEEIPPQAVQPETAREQADEQDAPVEWSFNAQLRPRLELRDNHSFGLADDELRYRGIYAPPGDTISSVSQRSRLGVGAKAGDVSALLQIQHAIEWGLFGGDALTDPVLFAHQAWLQYKPSDTWWVRAGRQQLAYGEHRVLGTVGWTQVGRAWDALRFGFYPSDAFGVDVFAGRYDVGSENPAFEDVSLFNQDAWLTGAYFKIREVAQPALDEIDLYALYDVQIDDLSDDQPNTRNVLGLGARLAGKWGLVDGLAEGVYELGSRCLPGPSGQCTDDTVDLSAWMIDTELGFSVYEPAALRLFVGYSRATGDDPDTADTNEAYFQFYPTAHKWMGLMDIIGPRSNVQEIKGGFSFKAGPFKLRESVHYFNRLEPESETVGLEFDTVASAKLTEILDLGVGHGLFVPSDGISSGEEPDGVANWVYLQMNAVF